MTNEIVIEAPTQEVINLKNLIEQSVEKLTQYKRDLKSTKEMITNAIGNSEKYRAAKKEEEKFKREKKAEELKIKSENPTIMDKIEDLTDDVKDTSEQLSDFLNEYVRLTGKAELEIRGETFPIRRKASVQLKLF